ncbi:MAG TPA: serine hydrolase [Burkholderiaceae bacterium]|nr:serine hydrolase [Burkholderiaceae bacterium]
MISLRVALGGLLSPLFLSLALAAIPDFALAQQKDKPRKAAKRAVSPEVQRAGSAARTATKAKSNKTQRAAAAKPPRRAAAAAGPARVSIGHAIGLHSVDDPLDLRSAVAMVVEQDSGEVLYQKNPQAVLPIASITKLMTAMVVLDADLPLHEMLEISDADRDTEKHTSSRLDIGSRLARGEMLQLALMASENRAASALARHYPGGATAFIAQMNRKARELGMRDSHFADSTGLSSRNVSSGRDLALLARAAHDYPLIREFSTAPNLTVDTAYRLVTFRSTNRLIERPEWQIGMQKTGYISEAGNCLVMQIGLDGRSYILVLLDSNGAASRTQDVMRLRRWLERELPPQAVPVRVGAPARQS